MIHLRWNYDTYALSVLPHLIPSATKLRRNYCKICHSVIKTNVPSHVNNYIGTNKITSPILWGM